MGKTRGLGFQKERWYRKEGLSKREVVPERRGPAKKKVMILAGGKMLEVEEDPGDQRDARG